jgi:hypothetical protein
MLAHIPARHTVTYRRLSQLQSSNWAFVTHKTSLLNASPYKFEDKFANTVREKFWSNRLHYRQTSTSWKQACTACVQYNCGSQIRWIETAVWTAFFASMMEKLTLRSARKICFNSVKMCGMQSAIRIIKATIPQTMNSHRCFTHVLLTNWQ